MKLSWIFLLLFASCSQFIETVDKNSKNQIQTTQKAQLVFSHNISGETHPCGCRQFPLGGLPQVYGLFSKLNKDSELLYVDTGDTFFPSSVIPDTVKSSLTFQASNLARSLDQLNLKYLTLGDQDFALGIDFLNELASKHKFQFLLSNLSNSKSIQHQKFGYFEKDNLKIYLLGFSHPEVMGKYSYLFLEPEIVMDSLLKELYAKGYNPSNSRHRLVVLSHSGIDFDESFAGKYPMIDWIIGAHSQSFLRFSKDVGNTKIVQGLSKNHYIGNITFDLHATKDTDQYFLHEIRDELEKEVNPNPLREFVNEHKNMMAKFQEKEQEEMVVFKPNKKKNAPIKNYTTCIQCHKEQGDFWKSTPHSLALLTLINAKEEKNLNCIGCHSHGLNQADGFKKAKDVINGKNFNFSEFYRELKVESQKIPSVRKLSSQEILNVHKVMDPLLLKHKADNNHAQVQCLNCHDQSDTHPFKNRSTVTKEERLESIKTKCLSCHTNDQSVEWYQGTVLKEDVFLGKLKQMSCPSLK